MTGNGLQTLDHSTSVWLLAYYDDKYNSLPKRKSENEFLSVLTILLQVARNSLKFVTIYFYYNLEVTSFRVTQLGGELVTPRV